MKDGYNEYEEYELDRGTDYFVVGVHMIMMLEEKGIKTTKAALLYGKILGLAKNRGGCVAGNMYFANALNVSERSIRLYLSQLMNAELLKKYEEKDNPYHTSIRHLYPLSTGDEETDTEIIELFGNVFRQPKNGEKSTVEESCQSAEESCQEDDGRGKILPKTRKSYVSTPEESCQKSGSILPPIIYNNIDIVEDNRRGRYAPGVAYAPEVAALQTATPEYIQNLKFNGNIPDDMVLMAMRNYCHNHFIEGIDIDEFREEFIETFISPSEYIKCEKEPVETFLDWFLEYVGIN